MLGKVADLFFGDDAGLQLSEQCADRLQRIELLRLPVPVTELAEA